MQDKRKVRFLRRHLRLVICAQVISIMVLLSVCNSCLSGIHNNSVQRRALNFRSVMETRGEGDYGYEPGRKLYPRYSYEGLPEDFVVKKSPDVSFKDRDIEYVEIKKDPFSPAHMSSYIVTIYLQGKSAERMRAFSEKHLKKRVAIEIDGKIINIPTINDIVENKFSIIFVKTSISDLENEIKKVTDKIRIE